MAGVEIRRDTADQRGSRLNALLGVGTEALNAAVDVLLMPSLILAFFVAELTPSYTTIGLVPAIAISSWTLARLPASLLTSGRRRQQPWALAAAVARAGAMLVLGVAVLRTDPNGLAFAARPLLGTFFLCLVVYALAGGFGSVPTTAMLRSVAPGAAWPAFVSRRAAWSAALCLLAGWIVYRLLGADGQAFPAAYGRLLLVAAILLLAAAVLTAVIREPTSAPARADSWIALRAWRQPLANPRFRRFFGFQAILAATAAIDPFLFLYAVTRLNLPLSAIGNYAFAAVLGWLVSAPLWLWLERRAGPRGALQGAAVVRLLAPAIALALPQVAAIDRLAGQGGAASAVATIYGTAFFAIGAALAAQSRGGYDYLAAVLPRTLLPSATMVTNAVLAVVAFAPMVGGAAIQRFGYEALFGLAAVLGLAAVFVGGRLAHAPFATLETPVANIAPRSYRALPAGRA
jgi:hypothetical protein